MQPARGLQTKACTPNRPVVYVTHRVSPNITKNRSACRSALKPFSITVYNWQPDEQGHVIAKRRVSCRSDARRTRLTAVTQILPYLMNRPSDTREFQGQNRATSLFLSFFSQATNKSSCFRRTSTPTSVFRFIAARRAVHTTSDVVDVFPFKSTNAMSFAEVSESSNALYLSNDGTKEVGYCCYAMPMTSWRETKLHDDLLITLESRHILRTLSLLDVL